MSLNTTFCLKTSVLFKYFECTSNTKTTSFRSKEKNRAFFINVELTKQWVLFWVPLLVLGSVENGNSLRLEAPGPGCHVSSLPSESGLRVRRCLQSASESAPREVMPERALGNQKLFQRCKLHSDELWVLVQGWPSHPINTGLCWVTWWAQPSKA